MPIRDLAFPFNRDATEFPASKEGTDVIADNIRRILLTAQGERVMRPEVGSKIQRFVFESVGPVLRARISSEVKRAIAQNEPRARVLAVRSVERVRRGTGGREVVVEVTYEVDQELSQVTVSF